MFEIYEHESLFVKHLKTEANQAMEFYKANGDNKEVDCIQASARLLVNLAKYSEYYHDTNRVIKTMSKFIETGLFSPLTLKEGEFIYTKPGLSVNRRFQRIQQDITGIFDTEGYKITDIEYYDVINNIDTVDEYICNYDKEANDEPNRIYLSTGGVITDIYFNKCYIKKEDIAIGKYIPKNTFSANVCKVIVNKKYINVVMVKDQSFKRLNQSYALNFTRDNKEENIRFGITENIEIDGLRTERSTL